MPRQERDDITLWVANDEYFYNQVMRLYDKWVDEGDAWHEKFARRELESIVEEIAEALFAKGFWDEPYTAKEKREAVDELLEDFDQYREDEIAERQKIAAAKPKPRKPMDEGLAEYTKKMDALLIKIGVTLLPDVVDHPVNMTEQDARQAAIDYFVQFMPASKDKIRRALDTGDEHLNTIKLRKWDDMVEKFGGRRFLSKRHMSLSDGVGILKHVAKWYYA